MAVLIKTDKTYKKIKTKAKSGFSHKMLGKYVEGEINIICNNDFYTVEPSNSFIDESYEYNEFGSAILGRPVYGNIIFCEAEEIGVKPQIKEEDDDKIFEFNIDEYVIAQILYIKNNGHLTNNQSLMDSFVTYYKPEEHFNEQLKEYFVKYYKSFKHNPIEYNQFLDAEFTLFSYEDLTIKVKGIPNIVNTLKQILSAHEDNESYEICQEIYDKIQDIESLERKN